jgi:dipeptidase E
MRNGGAAAAWRFIAGREPDCPMTELGWKSVGVLELTALPGLDPDWWVPTVRDADVLLVNGGDPMYLHHWMVQSGLAALLPTLTDTVYVGLSAGSMVMTQRIGEDFVEWRPPNRDDDSTLGLVDFAIFPHLDHPELPDNTMSHAKRWASTMTVPSYAIDDQTAIKVTDEEVEVISEGHWRQFEGSR